jgi:3-oxoacyl-[acyl-carrier protein] reductase/pteridine reductase
LAIQANVGNYQEVQSMVAAAVDQFGSVDILVNNASLWMETPFPTADPDDWHRVTNVLINGAFYCANAVAPHMLKNRDGTIINIIDLAAYEAWPNFTAHSVGKSALLALSRQLALELAPYVRVNAIAPGPVLPPVDYGPEKIARAAHRTLLERWGTPEDVAEAVLFFTKSNYITGEALAVDGGQRIAYRKVEHG